MISLHTQKKIRLVTVERRHAWVVLAFLVHIEGGQIIYVSEPKVVKTIAKKSAQNLRLNGLFLPATIARAAHTTALGVRRAAIHTIESPYFQGPGLIRWLHARPPTTA